MNSYEIGLSARYLRWQARLAAEFFTTPNEPIVMFIDDEELLRIGPEDEADATSLAAAVKEVIWLDRGPKMFAPIERSYQRWRTGDRSAPPPVLPLLALSVLAASRMAAEGQMRSTNYYSRFTELLVPLENKELFNTTRHDISEGGAFADVAELWSRLDRWITDANGRFGYSTIRTREWNSRISYPQSQAVLRRADRMILTHFFHAMQIGENAIPDSESMLRSLRLWAARPRRLSQAFLQTMHDDRLGRLLVDVVSDYAKAWDGYRYTSRGMRRIPLRISLSLTNMTCTWTAQAVHGEEILEFSNQDGRSVWAICTEGDKYYVFDEPLEFRASSIMDGLSLGGDGFELEFPPTPIVVFRPDPETGGWISCDSIEMYEDHVVVVRSDQAKEVYNGLEEASEGRIHGVKQPIEGRPLPGFGIITGVRVCDPALLNQALGKYNILHRADLAVIAPPRARFSGGLPIAKQLGRSNYLAGGEPDLLLADGTEGTFVNVRLDGDSQRFYSNLSPVPLRNPGIVASMGSHTVEVGDSILQFSVLDSDPTVDNNTSNHEWCGWDRELQFGPHQSRPEIVGADVRIGTALEPLLAKRFVDETVLLHHSGDIEQVVEPASPPFLSRLNQESPSLYYEVLPKRSVAWIAQRRGQKWTMRSVGDDVSHEIVTAEPIPEKWRLASFRSTFARGSGMAQMPRVAR